MYFSLLYYSFIIVFCTVGNDYVFFIISLFIHYWLSSKKLYSTLLNSTQLYSTLLNSTQLYILYISTYYIPRTTYYVLHTRYHILGTMYYVSLITYHILWRQILAKICLQMPSKCQNVKVTGLQCYRPAVTLDRNNHQVDNHQVVCSGVGHVFILNLK